MSLMTMNLESHYLQGNTEISIILPDKPRDINPKDFYNNGAKYKVLWLLHGTFGDHTDWIRKTNVELYACEKNLVVVIPSALNSDYSNWDSSMMGYAMYDYLTEELMPLIYNWLPVSSKRKDNFIAGLSMGGRGAIKYAVNHPGKFAGAASFSAVPRNAGKIKRIYAKPETIFDQRMVNKINDIGGLETYLDSSEYIWNKLADLANKDKLPRLYFTCGTKDTMYDDYQEFKKYAAEIGLKAAFEEIEDYAHEWRVWDLSLQRMLTFFGI